MKTTLEIAEAIRSTLEARKNDEFINLFDEQGVFEMPFAMEGQKRRFEGIEQLRAHYSAPSAIGKLLEIQKVHSRVQLGADPNVVTIELSAEGKSIATGEAFHFPSSIAVVTCKNGKIVHYRDYPNTLNFAKVAGMLPQLFASFSK